MKKEEIMILDSVLTLLESRPFNRDDELIIQYKSLCEKIMSQYEKERQHRRDKQDYHQNKTKLWKKEHPDQAKKHQDDYKTRRQKVSKNLKNGGNEV